MENLINADTKELKELINSSEELVLVDFWAGWCGPCKVLGPILEKIAEEDDSIKVVKVDVDSNPEAAAEYSIKSIPAVFLFKGGEQVNKFVGVKEKNEIKEIINKLKDDNSEQ